MRGLVTIFVLMLSLLFCGTADADQSKRKSGKHTVQNESVDPEKMLLFDMASDHIDVTVGFAGSTIELFGDRRDKDADVAIIVEGPERTITVWKKERILGAWVNRYYVKFNKIPVYYHYALSNPDFIKDHHDFAKKYKLGVVEMMETRSIKKSGGVLEVAEYKDILVENRMKNGIFPQMASEIIFLNDYFFRASFNIPPSVPTGDYKITSYLIKNNEVIETNEKMLKIKQVGINAYILKSSKKHAIMYSLFCIALAAMSGWIASIIRVRI